MASGDTLFTILPQDNEPPASNYATLDTRNSFLLLDFDASTQEAAVFRGVLPSNYDDGGLTLNIFWVAITATTGDVVWDAAWEEDNPNNNDIDSDNFGTASTVTTTTNGTCGKINKSTITITHANMGSPAPGDPFRIRIRRVAASGSDTMTGDAQLLAAQGIET